MRFIAQVNYGESLSPLSFECCSEWNLAHAPSETRKGDFTLLQGAVISGGLPTANSEVERGLVVGGDLRIDNRDELEERLREYGVTAHSSDADFVAAAYLRWGYDCPRQLIGDYAFVVWDERRQRLFCARDALGVRTLFYELTPTGVRVASELEPLLAVQPSQPTVDRPFIEAILEGNLDHLLHRTPYASIRRLAPGHSLVVETGGAALNRYWPPPSFEPLALGEEAVNRRFRELFTASVKARLRSAEPVGLAVSGGIDSSCLAVTAHAVAISDPGTFAPVTLFHKAFSQTRQADERSYFRAVAAACPTFRSQEVECDDCWGLREAGGDGGFPMGEPDLLMNRAPLTRLAESAAAAGCRVMIGGYGGDQVLVGDPYHLPSLLADVRPSRLLAEVPHFRRFSRTSPARLLATAGGARVLPDVTMAALRRWMRRRELGQDGLPLRPPTAGARRIAIPSPRLPGQCAREMYRQLMHGAFQAEMASLNTVARLAGMEWRHAFLDRPLVEFMLSIPGDTRFSGGVTKQIARESLADLLPPAVRERSEIAHFGWLFNSGMRGPEQEKLSRFVSDSNLVRAGYVDHERLKLAWSRWGAVDGPCCYRDLTNFLSLEAWLRHTAAGTAA